jgi:hypothetical protein
MRFRLSCSTLVVTFAVSWPALSQGPSRQGVPQSGRAADSVPAPTKVPAGVILVKGAWSSASDRVTPVPEEGKVTKNVFSDPYFGMIYTLPPDWTEKYEGPPPSDTGLYVLAQFTPPDTFEGLARGSVLITAQDLFFTPLPASDAKGLIDNMKNNLQPDYKVEMPPTATQIADRVFTFFAYWSPVAQMHWYVFAAQIRCHALQIVMTSRDTKLLQDLVRDMNKMKLSAEAGVTGGAGGGAVPVCIKDYARGENMIARVDPVFTEHRFNPVPVRIIIDQQGKVKHIHFLSAFSDQVKAISDSLSQWRFKQYQRNGQRVEVETGVLFGRPK